MFSFKYPRNSDSATFLLAITSLSIGKKELGLALTIRQTRRYRATLATIMPQKYTSAHLFTQFVHSPL
jgi:hypothetical protein